MTTSIAPRLLTLTDAAAYCGLSEAKFRGLYDGPLVQTAGPNGGVRMRRYDRHDLDQWIERLKGAQTAAQGGGDAMRWLGKAGFRARDRESAA